MQNLYLSLFCISIYLSFFYVYFFKIDYPPDIYRLIPLKLCQSTVENATAFWASPREYFQ